MPRGDWFRNTNWNPAIEAEFLAKHRRARDKTQPLRIQAHLLAQTHPEVALRLLDLYFGLGGGWDATQAYVEQATAFLATGKRSKAVESYLVALKIEEGSRNPDVWAALKFSLLVAQAKIKEHYDFCLTLLSQREARLIFPADIFSCNAARALILVELGRKDIAKEYAGKALDAAHKTHSGLRYHPDVGLVGKEFEDIIKKLTALHKE